jgi:hypothetical protein
LTAVFLRSSRRLQATAGTAMLSFLLHWYGKRQLELDHRPLIRAQAYGEAVDPDRLERLARYEVHLDRKLERMLAMLFKLQELRRVANPT